MDVKQNPQEQEAHYGEKMIEIKVRFWTNDIAVQKTMIKPKHGWTSGVIRIKRNSSHGIEPQDPLIFNSLMEIPAKIEQILVDHGIKLHSSSEMKKYLQK